MITDKQRRWSYRNWLGLPESVKEPTIYQLLGIEPFEENQTVIRNALEQRRAYIQSKRGQDQSNDQIAIALLNEIDDATAIVFAPEMRHQYNQANGIRKRPVNPRSRGSKRNRSRFWSIFASHRVEGDYVDGSGFLSTFMAIMAVIVGCFLLILLAAWYYPNSRLSKSTNQVVAADSANSTSEFLNARRPTDKEDSKASVDSTGSGRLPSVAPEPDRLDTVESTSSPGGMEEAAKNSKSVATTPTPAPARLIPDPLIPAPSVPSESPVNQRPSVGAKAIVLKGHHAMTNCLDISPDGRWAISGAHDGWVILWNLAMGKEVWAKELESGFGYGAPGKGVSMKAVCFGDSNDTFFAATRFHIHEVRRDTGQIIQSSKKFAKIPLHVSFSPDASTAAISSPQEFVFYDIAKMRQSEKVDRQFPAFALSRQGNFFVGSFEANDQNFLGRTRGGKVEHTLAGLSPRVESAIFSDDGRRVAAITGTGPAEKVRDGQGRVAIWELRGSTWEKNEWTADGWQRSLCFSHDGKLLATGGYGKESDWYGFAEVNRSKNVITIWDVATGRQLVRSDSHNAAILNMKFTPDDRRLVTVSGDSKVRIWNVADLINDKN